MRMVIPLLVGAALVSAPQAGADTVEAGVKADLARQASLAYAVILADAVKAGRLYPREAAASGAKRFITEYAARQYAPPQDVAAAK